MMGMNCSTCGNRVSREASACPCCGKTIGDNAGQKDPTQIIGIMVCGILLLGIIVCSAAIVMK